MKVDAALPAGSLSQVAEKAGWASRIGFDGVVTVETAHDPFLALAVAATTAPELDLETGIAVPSPVAHSHRPTAWDLAQAAEGGHPGIGNPGRAHITRRFGGTWSRRCHG